MKILTTKEKHNLYKYYNFNQITIVILSYKKKKKKIKYFIKNRQETRVNQQTTSSIQQK